MSDTSEKAVARMTAELLALEKTPQRSREIISNALQTLSKDNSKLRAAIYDALDAYTLSEAERILRAAVNEEGWS